MTEQDKINPFELVNRVNELPPELKEEVMATISIAHLVSDIGKLFTLDMGNTLGGMIDSSTSEDS